MIRKKMHKWIACLTAAICILSAHALPVHAQSAQTKIPVQQILKETDTNTRNSSFEYTLQATDQSQPMPSGAADGAYVFSMQGDMDSDISIDFSTVGIYSYTLRQTSQGKGEDWNLDETIYDIQIYVKQSENSGLFTEVLIKNSNMDKLASAAFTNQYKVKAPTPAPKPAPNKVLSQTKKTGKVKTGDSGHWGITCMAVLSFLFIGVNLLRRRQTNYRR